MNNQIMTTINRSIQEQDRVVALENCFDSWDDNLDLEVITQGLHDRFKAIGRPLEGIRFRRTSLKRVELDLKEKGQVTTHAFDYTGGILSWTSPDFTNILLPAEQTTLQFWLKDNYYEH